MGSNDVRQSALLIAATLVAASAALPAGAQEVRQQLTEAEAKAPEGHEIDHDEIAQFIEGVAHHDAGPENIARVAAKLAAAGWPLAGIELDPEG